MRSRRAPLVIEAVHCVSKRFSNSAVRGSGWYPDATNRWSPRSLPGPSGTIRWPAGSIFFAGAGVRAGQVIGATDRQGAFPTGRGYTPGDVAATIYHALGIDPAARLYDLHKRPHFVLPDGEPIDGVFA